MLDHALLRYTLVLAGAFALVLGGCGGDGNDKSGSKAGTPAAPRQLKLEADADGGLYFEPRTLRGEAGSVQLVMTNPKSTREEHGIAVRGNGVDQEGPVVKPGGIATVVAKLERGTYTFYCNYDRHSKKGMKGKLTIR
jgi:plastocyanin